MEIISIDKWQRVDLNYLCFFAESILWILNATITAKITALIQTLTGNNNAIPSVAIPIIEWITQFFQSDR
ncbi:hypothetical protein ACFLYV_03195 [Chloroflexota bacterium]